jgi:hypothetical protein
MKSASNDVSHDVHKWYYYNAPQHTPKYKYSLTWAVSQSLYYFVADEGRATRVGQVRDADPGDIVFFDFTADGHHTAEHAMVVTNVDPHASLASGGTGNLYLSGHTNNRLNMPWYHEVGESQLSLIERRNGRYLSFWIYHPKDTYRP